MLLQLLFLFLVCLGTASAFQSLPLVPHHVQQQRRRLTTTSNVTTQPAPRRRSRLSSTDRSLRAQQVGALYQGYGTHYVDLWCGSPTPQRQTVIVDTGSGVTAFPCSACSTNCGKDYHIDQVFEESKSSTFEPLECSSCMRGHCSSNQCSIGMSYQEGSSWSAFEAKDYCYIGGPHGRPLNVNPGEPVPVNEKKDKDGVSTADVDPQLAANHAFPLVFGCQTRLTGLFKTQLADGIMGMDNAKESFWKQMSAASAMKEDIFTLCFARQPTADRQGTEAGAMTLGGVDTRLHTSPIVYTQVGKSYGGFYGVHIRNVYLRPGGGGDSAISTNADLAVKRVDVNENDLNRGNNIVDSGTTDTYFTRNIASKFNALWQEMTGKSYNNKPVSLTEEQLNAMPTILFQLQGMTDLNEQLAKSESDPVVGLVGALDPKNPYDVLLAMPPSHYMEYDKDLKKYVPRFYTDEGSGSVLGANAMMGHDIVFDQVQGRLGIAESQCDYADLVTTLGFHWDAKESLPAEEKKAEEVESAEKKEGEEDEDNERKNVKTPTPGTKDNASSQGGGFIGLISGAVLIAIIAGVVVLRKRRASTASPAGIPVPYSSELELQGDHGNTADDDGEFGHYRDDDDESEEFQDEDIE